MKKASVFEQIFSQLGEWLECAPSPEKTLIGVSVCYSLSRWPGDVYRAKMDFEASANGLLSKRLESVPLGLFGWMFAEFKSNPSVVIGHTLFDFARLALLWAAFTASSLFDWVIFSVALVLTLSAWRARK